ncbi:MAG: hypothetical protein HQL24_05340 [Candidatus Omnitrophica bacterium]|nr:hypothetical protein [Candidatus Omnitrophota bacterium]
MSNNIIVILRAGYTAKYTIPLLAYLREKYSLTPIVFYFDFGNSSKPLLDEFSIENHYFNFYDNCIKSVFLRRILGTLGIYVLIERIYERIYAKKIIAQYNPKIIFTPVSTQTLSRAVINLANKRGIPTLSIQRTATYYRFFSQRWLEYIKEREGKKSFNMMNYCREKRLAWNRAVYRILGELWGVVYREPKCLGDGEEKFFLVIGERHKMLFFQEGVRPKSKMVVVGFLEHDQFYKDGVLNKEPMRTNARNILGLKTQEKVILIIIPSVGLSRCPELYDSNTYIVKTVLESVPENFKVIVKLHPQTRNNDLDPEVLKHPKIIEDKGLETLELLCASDFFISYYSTMNLNAIALDINMLTANISGIFSQEMCEHIGGGLHASSKEEFKPLLDQLLFDEVTQKSLASSRALARSRWMKCDGLVKKRIGDFMVSLMTQKNEKNNG